MQLAGKNIVVESSGRSVDSEKIEHIKLVVDDKPGMIFHLSLKQARSLAMSLVEQVHRLEVANSMHQAKQQQSCSVQFSVKTQSPRAPKRLARNLPALDNTKLDLSDFPVHAGLSVLR